MTLKTKRIFLIVSFLFFVCLLVFAGYEEYSTDKKRLYESIDQKLKSAAFGTSFLISDDFISRAYDGNVSKEEDLSKILKLSEFAKHAGVQYVYAVIKKNQDIIFVSSSATDDELASGKETLSFDIYKDASNQLKLAFEKSTVNYDEYKDKWGEFRSVFIPLKSNNGKSFVVCADIRIDEIDKLLAKDKIIKGLKVSALLFFAFILFYWQFSKTNKALKEQNKLLENEQNALFNVFDNGQTVLIKWKISPETKIEHISKSIRKLTGFEADEIKNDTNLFLGCFDDTELNKIFEKIQENSNNQIDSFKQEPYRIKDRNGETKIIIDETYVLRNKNGQIDFYLSFLTDITEEEKKEQLIFEQTKLDAMQEVVGNIAHHWRQPLSAISTIASSIELKLELEILDLTTLSDDMRQIILATDYLSETIEFFGGFIKSEKVKTNIVLQDVVKKVAQFMTYTLENEKIKLRLNLVPHDLTIFANKSDMEQVLISLIDNSKDAIKNHKIKNGEIVVDLFSDDKFSYLKVADNGGGIPVECLSKIFEPYFTTKHQARGVGMGLHICHEITRDAGGQIEVSNENNGAVISIKIPISKHLS